MNTEGKIRKAWVAGKFYPAKENDLNDLMGSILRKELKHINFDPTDKKIIGAILPHAGHIYSGYQTVHFFEALKKSQQKIESFIILHPFHRGGFHDYATDENDFWNSPFGDIRLDKAFIDRMDIYSSSDMHKWEHSAEVIIPFIQYFNFGEKKIIPIGISWQHPESAKEIAQKIYSANTTNNQELCILASSDFSHFVNPEEGKRKDQKALDKIMEFDPEGLYQVITDNNLSICGYGPIMTLLYYCRFLNEKVKVEILARGHSGEISTSQEVVDYISMIFYI
ncbi:MAG: AmmeMemoRadiSam system protein B [Bacteroidota bacterium]